MGKVKAKFYCPSCKRFFGEDEISPEISALLRDSGEQMPVCKNCGETLEYALWRPLDKHYWKFQKEHHKSDVDMEKAEAWLKDLLTGSNFEDYEVHDFEEVLADAVRKVYPHGEPKLSFETYHPPPDNPDEWDFDACIYVGSKDYGEDFAVRLTCLGGAPFGWGSLQEAMRGLDEFVKRALERREKFLGWVRSQKEG